MIRFQDIDFLKIKSKFQVKKPWDDVIVSILSILITIPSFIIFHENIIQPNWPLYIDSILIFILLFIIIHLILRQLRTILIVLIGFWLIALIFGSIFGYYGFSNVIESYRSMVYTMSDNANPEDVVISKLLPFPNKNKIIKAIDYDNPRVRNFALMATTKRFKNIKGFKKYRTLTQCFAVFKEINDRWNYVNDPKGKEYIARASESVLYLSGDCDDHSILMSACVRAIGGTPRIISTKNHLYPEILIGNKADFEKINFLIKEILFKNESKTKTIHYHIDEHNKIWLNLDYTAKYPGGPFMSKEILGELTLY
jgi:energy-coupling factor transporter transmembrane protein EcfT